MTQDYQIKKRLGQNTAEYLIMLTLVAIGSISLFAAFGKTLHNKIAFISAAISGDADQYEQAKANVSKAASAAITKATTAGNIKMEGIDASDLQDSGLGK